MRKPRARYALAYCTWDPAGAETAKRLMEWLGYTECESPRGECYVLKGVDAVVLGFEEDTIYMDFLDNVVEAEAYIILSRHSSASGKPTLSVHHPGNPCSRADYGGRPRELAWAHPRLATQLLRCYYESAERRRLLGDYVVTLEATHHGPTSLRRPVVFIEIGSREEQWRDARAQEAMAEAVIEALRRPLPSCRCVVGVGGTHYPEKHTRLALEEYCYGHILAKYVFQELDKDMLVQAVEKSVDRIEAIVLLKVPSRVKKLVAEVAKEKGLEVIAYT